MGDFANLNFPVDTPIGMLSTFGEGSSAGEVLETISSLINSTAAVWPAALRALYYPVTLQRSYTVTKAAWVNGGTINGNVDVGIYDENGNLLVSKGTTAQSGASAIQVVDLTDTTVGPGVVFLAMVSDSATGTFVSNLTSTVTTMLRAAGVQQQTLGAMPLPSTWTPANIASSTIPVLSFSYDNAVLA